MIDAEMMAIIVALTNQIKELKQQVTDLVESLDAADLEYDILADKYEKLKKKII